MRKTYARSRAEERKLNALILSSSDKIYAAATELLRLCGNFRTARAENITQARILTGQRTFGIAIINADSSESGYRDIALRLAENCVSTVFIPKGADDGLTELYDSGIFVVAGKPITKAGLYVAIRGALGVSYRYEKLLEENARLKEKLETLKITSRAKCILEQSGMTEEEAHREIERIAMTTRRSALDVARQIIDSEGTK